MRIINRVDDVTAARISAKNRVNTENGLSLAAGQINIANSMSVAAVMLDLQGVSASDITLAARANDMSMMTSTLADGTLRVVIISEQGNTLEGNDGAVLNVSGSVKVVKAIIADVRGTEYVLIGGEPTAIESITNAVKDFGKKVYSVGGQLMNGMKKGFNIIRNADGSSTKVYNK